MNDPWFVNMTTEQLAEVFRREDAELESSRPHREAAARRMAEYNRKAHAALAASAIEKAKATGRQKYERRKTVDDAKLAAARQDVAAVVSAYKVTPQATGYVNVYGEHIHRYFHIIL